MASERYVKAMRQLLLQGALEVKRDDACLKYPGHNLFVEVARRDGRPSGIMTSTSDTYAFHVGAHDTDDGEVTGGVVVLVQTDRLRDYCVDAVVSHSPNVRSFPNIGVLLPWSDLLKLV